MAQETKEIDVRAWCVRILKNWYWIVLSCAVCGALGLYYYMSHTKQYKVDANIMIRTSDDGALPQTELLQLMGVGGNKMTEDEVAILTSRDIMAQVIKDLDIQTEYRKKDGLKWVGQYPQHDLTVVYPPVFLDTTTTGVSIDIKVRKNDYVVNVKTRRFQSSKHTVKDLTKPIETCAGEIYFLVNAPLERGDRYHIYTGSRLPLIDAYKTNITASPMKKESNVIVISTTTDMPKRAVDFINKEIELYNMDAVVDKNTMATSTAAFIEERLKLIEQELAGAESEVERYKEKHGIVDLPSEAELYLTESTEYRKRAADIETQLNLVQYISEFVSDNTKRNSLIPANLGISDQALVALISEYNTQLLQRMRVQRTATDNNPVVDQMTMQLDLLRDNIITSITSVRKSLLISKQDLETRFNQAERQRYGVPSQERQYVEIERKRQLTEALYLFLYQKREENALTLASTVVPAKIIATPQMTPNPVSPKLKYIGLICLFLGICIPIGVLYLIDLFNNKISDDTREFERKITVPFGGALVRNHHGNHIAVREGENSVSAELFRSLRTNIRFILPPDIENPVILVTSSVNGEGKSYVASNLAISLALLQKKVALVGLDIRKPMLATYFDLPSKGCLTSYLSDSSYTLEDTIVHSDIPYFDILPAGTVPPNPNELLQGNRLDQLFQELREQYDYIIVDSAPVALVSDTFQLARISDMTLYVSRANYTTTDLIDYLNTIAEKGQLPKIVSILNGVRADVAGYGYGYGYGYGQHQHRKWWQKLFHIHHK